MLHTGHFIGGAAALAVALALYSFTLNRHVHRRMQLSIFFLGFYVVLHAALWFRPGIASDAGDEILTVEHLALAAGLVGLIVVTLINPLRADRVPERFPVIVQDAIVFGLLLVVSTFVFNEKLLTTGAVSAVVVGFALQDTLGNAFSGLALQSEKPFRVGHWIRVGDFEGRVAEITWRATKLRTKSGNFVILPNNFVSKEAVTNYSEPAVPTRLEIEVGASYLAAPNVVKAAIHEAMGNSPRVLAAPPPDVVMVNFDASSINYRARLVDDLSATRWRRPVTAIHHASRQGIRLVADPGEAEKPWVDDGPQRMRERMDLISGVDLFTALAEGQRLEIAAATATRLYGSGEAIVRQGQPGESMYVIASGTAAIVLEPDHREVATIERGGYFGEMSLLTGEPRSATVISRGDTVVLEIGAKLFRQLGDTHPQAIEQVGVAAMTRRARLNEIKSSAEGPAVVAAPATPMARMKKFLGL